jgi:hypothetical protein
MTTIVSFSVQSAYGRVSGRFDAGRFCDGAAGFGKLLVAFGSIKKVDAGASTFCKAGFGVLEVCSSGPAPCQMYSD